MPNREGACAVTPDSADSAKISDAERVLVTGGAGFIGSSLVKALVANGCEVTVLDNLSSGCRANLAPFPQVRFIEGVIRDPDAVDRAIRGGRVVFHLAASVGNKRSIDDPISDAEINVLGTLRVVEAARAHKVRKVVASSSAGIFGELKTLAIREDPPDRSRHALWGHKAVRREALPGLFETPWARGHLPSVLRRLRSEPAIRCLRQRDPHLCVPDAARGTADGVRRRGTNSRFGQRRRCCPGQPAGGCGQVRERRLQHRERLAHFDQSPCHPAPRRQQYRTDRPVWTSETWRCPRQHGRHQRCLGGAGVCSRCAHRGWLSRVRNMG